ncbi:DNA-binding transcriptional LysR family regulator [Archangium gephyra]|uniref:DNA-binding transcriptional LysR family regulator n=1 Tax=Archangium gephyra TaxID=48 RepID=A0AAC8QAV5_9BACT|nr:LysR family transcriptional regulator [Archangium gephyra]AKJ03696.1 Transcriptional regulator, LysR family [Archangium gephyra]REG22523.1 DNA-binding transcriptional LysR family regulator [Archangium gephyra]
MEKLGNLRGIIEFVAAAEAGSFSAAARQLGVSVAHVSRRVAALERDLGVQLLKRNSRSSVLTEQGRAFHQSCRDILGALEEARDSARSARQLRGRLRVSMGGYYAEMVLAPLLGEFAALHPGISLELEMTLRLVRLVEEDVDLVVRTGPLEPSSLVSRRLVGFPLLTLAAPTLYTPPPSHPRELDPRTCLGLHDRPWVFERADERLTLRPEGRVNSNSGTLLIRAAAAGAGAIQVPSYFGTEEVAAGRLVPLLPDWSAGEMEFFLLYPEQRHLPARLRALIDFLLDRVRRDTPSGD